MLPFILLFIFLGITNFVTSFSRNSKNARKQQAIIGALSLWILMALRSWTCGQDLLYEDRGVGYIISFCQIGESNFNDILNSRIWGYEIGFNILNWLIYNFISVNPQVYLAVIGALEIGLIGYTIYRKSPYIILSYLVFACLGLYIFSFSGLRQGLGIALTFFSFLFIDDKKPWKFFAIICIAFTIHKSAIIFLPAYFVRNFPLTKRLAFMGIISIFLILPFLMSIIQFFSVLIYDQEKYANEKGGAYGLFLLYILIFSFSYCFKNKTIVSNRIISQLHWMSLIAIFLQSSGILSAGSLARISYSYTIFFCLLLPYTLYLAPTNIKKGLMSILVLSLISIFIYINKNGPFNVVPYRFFWEEIYHI